MSLVRGSIASENLPSRVHDVYPVPRRPIIVCVVQSESKRTKHSSLKSIVGNLKRMVLGQWKFEEQESLVKLHLFDDEHVLHKFEVIICSSLKFHVSIFGWYLILRHPIYKQNEQSFEFLSMCDLLDTLESYTLCSGVSKLSCVAKTVVDLSGPQTSGKSMIVRHTIPVVKDANENFSGSDSGVQPMPFKVCTFCQTEKCEMLCQTSLQIYCSCLTANEQCLRELEKKKFNFIHPLFKKSTLSVSPIPHLVATINQHRLECKQLEQRMKQMEWNEIK